MYIPTTTAHAHVYLGRELLLACDTWCSLFVDLDTAGSRVEMHERRNCDLAQSYCIISREDGWQRSRAGRGGKVFVQSGAVEFGFMLKPPAEFKGQLIECDADILNWADDVVSNCVVEMEQLADAGSVELAGQEVAHLGFVSSSIEDGPWIWSPEELSDLPGMNPYEDGYDGNRWCSMNLLLEVE